MKTNLSTNDMQDALARLNAARNNKSNAARRLTRAQASVETALKDVSTADDELKAASANLDQVVRKGMSLAMKKGGTDISIAIAEILAKSLDAGDGSGSEDPEPAAKPADDKQPEQKPADAGTPPDAAEDLAKVGTQPNLLGASD